uniref:FHA domain-containing protein n=1 Tax=Ciona savignyi TaxID=51511 RepID=H2Y4M2_CIOSA
MGEVKQVSVSKQRRRNSSSDSDSSSDSNSELSGNKNHKHPNDRAENSRKKGKRSRSTSESGSSSSSDSSDDNEQLKRTKEKSHRHKSKKENNETEKGQREIKEYSNSSDSSQERNPKSKKRSQNQSKSKRDRIPEKVEKSKRKTDFRERRDGAGEVEEAFKKEEEKVEKEKPNLGLSGALTADTNTFKGVVIKYNEPPEARVPKKRWRLYPFKGTENLKASLILHLHRQSAYLLGRLRRIADIPIDHPSCSKQHAVFQFRLVLLMDIVVDGVKKRRVKPYIIDLGSANGTYVNNERIEAQRYLELKEKDLLKFGFSSREYVLLHDKAD